jgi:hypothetical protein
MHLLESRNSWGDLTTGLDRTSIFGCDVERDRPVLLQRGSLRMQLVSLTAKTIHPALQLRPQRVSPRFSLQRLPQPFLQLRAIRPAHPGSRAVAQNRVEFAMRDGLQLQDALDIHDG